jgi:hypothetical protein
VNQEIESRSIHGTKVTDEEQRESALEDSALRFALFRVGRKAVESLSKGKKRVQHQIKGQRRRI